MSTPAFAIVPAAGVGRRMGSPIPKQYLPLRGGMAIDHTLERLLAHPRIKLVVVAINTEDGWWAETKFAHDPRILTVIGGRERCHSVFNALSSLTSMATDQDWILVHDAVRPCLRKIDLDLLFANLDTNPIGGLLAVPVRDTMKRTDIHKLVSATESRANLWHAYTPQMFRYWCLRNALTEVLQQALVVTDESEAVELMGYKPLLVEGHRDNIKITHVEDLALAEFWLAHYQNSVDNYPVGCMRHE